MPDLDRGDGAATPRVQPDGSLPWIHARSSITDGRDQTVQLHLQALTADRERDIQGELRKRLGDEPHKADIREAAYLVGMQYLDDVEEVLREWGYGQR